MEIERVPCPCCKHPRIPFERMPPVPSCVCEAGTEQAIPSMASRTDMRRKCVRKSEPLNADTGHTVTAGNIGKKRIDDDVLTSYEIRLVSH